MHAEKISANVRWRRLVAEGDGRRMGRHHGATNRVEPHVETSSLDPTQISSHDTVGYHL